MAPCRKGWISTTIKPAAGYRTPCPCGPIRQCGRLPLPARA
jgi:hypothetical protein